MHGSSMNQTPEHDTGARSGSILTGVFRALVDNGVDYLRTYGVGVALCAVFILGAAPEYLAVTSAARNLADDVRSLPDAANSPAGSRALLDGTIADDAEPVFRHFVAYVKESYVRGRGSMRSYWAHEEGLISAFVVVSGARRIALAEPDYEFTPYADVWPVTWLMGARPVLEDWDHVEHRDGDAPGGSQQFTRHRGFVAGGPVIAIGHSVSRDRFDADIVLTGPREETLARLDVIAGGAGLGAYFWCMVAGLALLALILGFWVRALVRDAKDATQI
jgi:hypothetical protein